MAKHNLLGAAGEEAALLFLIYHGYEIREHNWFFEHLEVDIIAEKVGLIAFVEVKTRSTELFGNPEEAVNKEKENNLINAANAYMRYNDLDNPVRFDIISVIGNKEPFRINHIKDAFRSPLFTIN